MKGHRFLITGARAHVAADLIEKLSAQGALVWACDSRPWVVSRGMNGLQDFWKCPPARQEPSQFANWVAKKAKELNATVLSICEEGLYLDHKHFDTSNRLWAVCLEDRRKWHCKYGIVEACSKLPIRLPICESLEKFEEWPDKFLLKCKRSRFGNGVITIPSAKALKMARAKPEEWFWQEILEGPEICVTAAWQHGQLLSYRAYPAELRLTGSACLYFESVRDNKIEEFLLAFGDQYNVKGFLSFDLKMGVDGPALIECNPRPTSGIHLWSSEELSRIFLGIPESEYTHSAVALKFPCLLQLPRCIQKGRLGLWKKAMTSQAFPNYLRHPRSIVWEILAGIQFSILAAIHSVNFTTATTLDIEWNGTEES